VPQWSNEAILELKFTFIAFAIGVTEITTRAEQIGYRTFEFFDVFLLVAVVYLVLTALVAEALQWGERRVWLIPSTNISRLVPRPNPTRNADYFPQKKGG